MKRQFMYILITQDLLKVLHKVSHSNRISVNNTKPNIIRWPVVSDVIILTEPYDPPVCFTFLLSYLIIVMWIVELK